MSSNMKRYPKVLDQGKRALAILISGWSLILVMAPGCVALAEEGPCGLYDPYRYTVDDELDVYRFPIVPGTPEWKEQRRLAREELGPEPESFLEVPDSVKSRMSTMGLAWTCLKAPLRQPWGTYSIATPSFQMLERAFYLRIGGCRELARRGDFAESLLQIYMDYDPEHLALCSHWPPLGKMYFQEDLGVLEILLGSEEILEQLAPEERTELLRLLLSRYSTRKDQTGGSSTLSALTGRILLSLNFEPLVEACEADESLETFLDSPVLECTSSRYASLGEKVMESGNRYLQLHELD